MSKIKIETLSAVHIGSGETLQNNTDFVVEIDKAGSLIHVVDEQKILQLIGEENVFRWLTSIEKQESTKKLIKRLAPHATYSDYTRRTLTCFATNISPDATLKENIHNGLGNPYIPGSSIKGSVRTAILSSLSVQLDRKYVENTIKLKNNKGEILHDRYNNIRLSANKIEQRLFGNDPNSDIFRFIRIGDAYFKKNSLIATRMMNLNIRSNHDNLFDQSKPQLIEAIGVEEESSFNMSIAKNYYEWVKPKFNSLGDLSIEFNSIPNLFMLINGHTKQLVEYEIEYWNEVDKTGAEIYIEIMEELLEEINSCKNGKSCVLRIGHGSGWRFITGAWTEKLDNFYPDIPNAARPRNNRYSEYDFPKTRRVDEDSEILGFVKLTIEE